MIAQQVAGKATRDAFFLSQFEAARLPLVMAGSAGLSLLVVLAIARLMSRYSPARAVPAVFVVSGLMFAGEAGLAVREPGLTAVLLYLHTAAFGAALVSAFWSVINERYDPHTAKRAIGRIAGGAAAGGVIGGVVAWQVGTRLPVWAMLLILAATCMVCALGVARLGGDGSSEPEADDSPSAARLFREIPYLRHLALLVALTAVVSTVVDYVFKAAAADAYTSPGALVSFFSIFYTVTGLATFAVQSVASRPVLARFGLTGAVATLPGVIFLGAVGSLVFPGLWAIVLLRGSENTVESSLYRSGYELLYTPLAPEQKRPTKTIIDVGFKRIGAALGSGVVLLILWLARADSTTIMLAVIVAGALIAAVISNALHRGYVRALAASLRSGAVRLADEDVVDAVTQKTLASTSGIPRQKLLDEIAALRRRGGTQPVPDEPASEPTAPAASADVEADPLALSVAGLRSGNPGRVRQILAAERSRIELVAFVLPLLADDSVREPVLAWLRELAPRVTGQIADRLLDPQSTPKLRRRIPRVLARCPTQACADALLTGLGDAQFEVRFRCAVALYRVTAASSDLRLDEERVLSAARRAAEVGRRVWDNRTLSDASIDDSGPFAEAEEVSPNRSLQYIFTLLALVLDREPLLLAYRAIAASDDRLRGTGLEYLENVVPEDIRRVLWPLLGSTREARRGRGGRERREIVEELVTSMTAVGIDREAVLRAVEAARKSQS